MTSCDPQWVGLIMLTGLLIVPFGIPLTLAGWRAWRRGSHVASLVGVVFALAGLVAFALATLGHPADPEWLPWLFAAPLVAFGAALVTRVPAWRVGAFAASFVPIVGALAYGIELGFAWHPCA